MSYDTTRIQLRKYFKFIRNSRKKRFLIFAWFKNHVFLEMRVDFFILRLKNLKRVSKKIIFLNHAENINDVSKHNDLYKFGSPIEMVLLYKLDKRSDLYICTLDTSVSFLY